MQKNNVILRKIKNTDADVLMELNNDLEIAKCVVGNPQKVTIQEQIQWMNNIEHETNTVRFMVDYNTEPVGTVIISDIKKEPKTANVNIKLLKKCRRLGVGTNAIELALEYCFEILDLYCVTAHILTDNQPSQRLFEKIGFVKEGILRSRTKKDGQYRDLISYSILCSEYHQHIRG